MGIEPPFLYDNPSKFSFSGPTDKGFNPRASSQATWSPARPKPKQDGPLIDAREFNRHPDSYSTAPYGNLNWKPMKPNTKTKVKYVRWLQLFFRICALTGAIGMLFCVICIKGTQGTEGWIIRVPPGVAVGHTVYAIHHFARSAKGRTPASSASYMIFAAVLDAGLIPFFVFSAIMSRTQYTKSGDVQDQWQTLFNSDDARFKIIFSNFLFSVVDGGFHLISLSISLYLANIFRQISKLPPDMNPLEDNLTSRHKRNKSSLLDNRMSQRTTSATMTTNRNSKTENPLISPPRTVPFMQTRADSLTNLARLPYPDSSPRTSRVNLPYPLYDEPLSKRSSIADIGFLPSPPRPTSSNCSNETRSDSTRPPSTNGSRSTAPSIPDDTENWTTHPSPPLCPVELKHLRNPTYQPLLQTQPYDVENDIEENITPRPLEMNPPTPPNNYAPRQGGADPSSRVLVSGNGNVMGFGIGVADRRGRYEGLGNGKMRAGERVVSRTGSDARAKLVPAGGIGRAFRAREVSGKVAEEGRGYGWI